MSSIQELTLAQRNLKLSYENWTVVEHAGHHFRANSQNILWLERLIAVRTPEASFVEDIHGFPVHIADTALLKSRLCEKFRESATKYTNEVQILEDKLAAAFAKLPTVPENEE